MNYQQKTILLFATGFKLGNIPFAPGTIGTLIGLPLCFLLSMMDFLIAAFCVFIFVLLAIWISHRAEKILKLNDPGCIVIDEISGFMITLLGIPFSLIYSALGFFIFRVIDICKPFPIRFFEKKISGGIGIVIDDVIAGIYSNMLIRIVLHLKETY